MKRGAFFCTQKQQKNTNIKRIDFIIFTLCSPSYYLYTYGTTRANAYRILEDSLNLRDVRMYDKITDSQGKEKRVLNKDETTLAQQKQQLIKDAFTLQGGLTQLGGAKIVQKTGTDCFVLAWDNDTSNIAPAIQK